MSWPPVACRHRRTAAEHVAVTSLIEDHHPFAVPVVGSSSSASYGILGVSSGELIGRVGDRREAISATSASWYGPRTSMSSALRRAGWDARRSFVACRCRREPLGGLARNIACRSGRECLHDRAGREGKGRESSLCGGFDSGRWIGRSLAQTIGLRG